MIKANSFLCRYYTQFQHLNVDPHSHLTQNFTTNSRKFEKIFLKLNPPLAEPVFVYQFLVDAFRRKTHTIVVTSFF